MSIEFFDVARMGMENKIRGPGNSGEGVDSLLPGLGEAGRHLVGESGSTSWAMKGERVVDFSMVEIQSLPGKCALAVR